MENEVKYANTLDLISSKKNRANILGKTNAFIINIIKPDIETTADSVFTKNLYTSTITCSSEYINTTADTYLGRRPVIPVLNQTIGEALRDHPSDIDCRDHISVYYTNFFVKLDEFTGKYLIWWVRTRNSYEITLKLLRWQDETIVNLSSRDDVTAGFYPVNFGPQNFYSPDCPMAPQIYRVNDGTYTVNRYPVDSNGDCIYSGKRLLKTTQQVYDETY